jgi:hypothetical protein
LKHATRINTGSTQGAAIRRYLVMMPIEEFIEMHGIKLYKIDEN